MVAQVLEYLAQPFVITPASRLYVANWIVFVGCGLAVFALASRRGDKSARSALAFIFPREFYFHRSSLPDVKLYIAGFFVRLSVPGFKTLGTALVGTAFAALAAPLFPDAAGQELTFTALAALTLLVAMASDLVSYCTHRLSHEWAVLWPFHEVHHSAEVLTPITVSRKHPVYGLVNSLLFPLIAGPLTGVLLAAFGQLDFLKILGINAVYAVFNFAGANLRHSHIWISFGPVLSRVFVSPAMHQIHHSIDPKHFNKNYGQVFALWDWAFGSIYVPEAREELTFGLTDRPYGERVQPHGNLREAYIRPFFDSYDAIKGRAAKPAPLIDTSDEAEMGTRLDETLDQPAIARGSAP